MSEKRQQPLRKSEREADQKRTSARRRQRQALLERYEARPLVPEPEPTERYKP